MFCSGSSTSSSADDGSPRKSIDILSTSSNRNSGFLHAGARHVLQHLARQRADVGAAVAADLGLVAHAAERHAHELAVGRARDRLAERGLADAGRADQAEDRALEPLHALRDGQVLDDALLDLLEAEVVLVEDLLRGRDVVVHLRALLPRHLDQPVDVVADDRRLGGHRRHELQLVELGGRLLARLLGHAGLGDALFQVAELVRGVLEVAELLLDRLHLLVEVVLALALLHLRLHAAADLLLDLQHLHLALDQGHHLLEARAHVLRTRAPSASRRA